ncbi:predicted protein [Chaetoceros tenuissimus]|uniref:Ricin B lectin domain-containing protein n=1 Tax=Chaetoceros tenuissimus TaxID=426638 RepID=A0AAD3HAS5_9STRA|nr:predicted protein [Chaetoceros tenuissimus]
MFPVQISLLLILLVTCSYAKLSNEDHASVQTGIDSINFKELYMEKTADLLNELDESKTCESETLSLIHKTQMDSHLMNLVAHNMPSADRSSQEFLIKSPLGDCLTAADKDVDQQLLIQKCKLYDNKQNNLQLWTQGPHGEIKLAGPSEDYCIKSRHQQLLLGACTDDENERNFELGSDFISQSKHGKTWRLGYEAWQYGDEDEYRFGQVRLYIDIVLREEWSIVTEDESDGFLIKSTNNQLDQSNAPLGWCLTPADKDVNQQLLIQKCKLYDNKQNNLQLWTQGTHGEIKLAGPNNESERNFELGSDFISQSKHGKTWRFGYDAERRFGQVRLYRDIILRGWTIAQIHEDEKLEFSHLFALDACQRRGSVIDCDMEDFMDDLKYRCLNEDGQYFTMNILISGEVDVTLRNVGNCAGVSCNFDKFSIDHDDTQVLTSKMASGSVLRGETFALLVMPFLILLFLHTR